MTADMLAWVRAEMDAAEAVAQEATQGPWFANEYVHDDDFDASIGTGQDPLREEAVDVVGHGYEGGGVVHMADAVHIARHNPAAVLRRIAADRRVLDGAEVIVDGWCEKEAKGFARDVIRGIAEGWGWTSGPEAPPPE